jgi:hypothetical protein
VREAAGRGGAIPCRDAGRAGGKVDGLPDVVAFFPDGKIVLREAKNVGARDSLRDTQHEFARAARRLFGSHVDIAVVEWGAKDRSKAADHKRRSEA